MLALRARAMSEASAPTKKKGVLAKANQILGLSPPPSKSSKATTHAASASSTIGAVVSADVTGDDDIPELWDTDSDDDHVALEHTSLADQIRERAEDMCEDRAWTSLFDLLVFAFLRKRRVHACFGAQVVNLV